MLSKKKIKEIQKIVSDRQYLFNEYNSNYGIIKENSDEIIETFNITGVDLITFLSVFRGYWFQFYFNEEYNLDEINLRGYIDNEKFIETVKSLSFINDNRENVTDSEDLNKLDYNSIFASIVVVVSEITQVIKRTSSSRNQFKLF